MIIQGCRHIMNRKKKDKIKIFSKWLNPIISPVIAYYLILR